jgi:hypothetical protein
MQVQMAADARIVFDRGEGANDGAFAYQKRLMNNGIGRE